MQKIEVSHLTDHPNPKVRLAIEFHAERPLLRDSKDKKEFWQSNTRYYLIDGKTFDADTHDKLMGKSRVKAEVLPKYKSKKNGGNGLYDKIPLARMRGRIS
jgi:hypothetical protein